MVSSSSLGNGVLAAIKLMLDARERSALAAIPLPDESSAPLKGGCAEARRREFQARIVPRGILKPTKCH